MLAELRRFARQLWEKLRDPKELRAWSDRTHVEEIHRGEHRVHIAKCDACGWWGKPYVDEKPGHIGGALAARKEAGFHAGREHLF